ncbi:4-(cytidine 5'-diphospho)-2-C-methyl-D-erythritol kinase [Consotaella salsifontis]|uniref:4-diphosphocytidyl-2-C-methyl-D-erythritol kinase n=1 Tax=Consotaella salsifontis TaxID=1365950 RepID=A0A1T4N0S1_9HYPH|nr:4-(cytidine 5'-diphospho)-2-C-methyl-D-erythritol kinase [Consotaella salsifontis]SJZ72706.1 4-diphosphocytidyl-2-C-methyl-D-erythritol kinase [Consotaella salsifontis]
MLAPAKINLALHVTGSRPDGYHELDSLVAFAEHGDILTIEPAGLDYFEIVGPFSAALSADEGNLVTRALTLARRLSAEHGESIPPLSITLDKRLPIASGIGGGSADAAALLRLIQCALPELGPALSDESIALGADVPMCLLGQPARVRGIGESIEPWSCFPRVPLVLVNPGVAVSTPAVFRGLVRKANPPLDPFPARSLTPRLLADVLLQTRNDLQEPAEALAPVIKEVHRSLEAIGALFTRMSGSGATVFGLFASDEAAQQAATSIRATRPDWWTLATALSAAG